MTLKEAEAEMIAWWQLSAFLMFAAVGVHSLITHENSTLKIPHRQKLLIVSVVLIISILLSLFAIVEYIEDYTTEDLQVEADLFDEIMVFTHASLLGIWMLAQAILSWYILRQPEL